MPKKKDFYTLCEELVDRNATQDDMALMLDHMLLRVAIETVKHNYNQNVPIENLFTHLKEQTKIDIECNQEWLKRLERVELIKIMKGGDK